LAELNRREKIAAKAAHRILFALMFLLPLSGYVISTSDGKAIAVIGALKMPALFAVSDEVREAAVLLHYWLAYFALALAAAHAAAALKHHFADKNAVLRRMLF
jgi:cytochrome b561